MTTHPKPILDLQVRPGVFLTPRELEVCRAIALGKCNKEIARELCISPKTAEKHRHSLYNKLDAHSIALVTHYALAHGLVENIYAAPMRSHTEIREEIEENRRAFGERSNLNL